jgi:hypothetical protein
LGSLRRVAACYRIWIELALCLTLFTGVVRWWFVPGWLARHYADPFPLLGERTGARTLGVLFDLLPWRVTGKRPLVFLVGDSSVGGSYPARAFLGYKLQTELGRILPGGKVQVVDCSMIGTYAQDALVVAAKAFAFAPDLVVYAVSPRILPVTSTTPFATGVGDLALEPDVVSRLGLPTALWLVGPENLGRSLVYSWWAPARLRVMLAQALVETLKLHAPRAGDVVERLAVGPVPKPPAGFPGAWLWPRKDYAVDVPSRSRDAFDAMVDLCGREGRCLIYHVPVNPAAVGGFEPGLDDEFVDYVRSRTTAAKVPFVDERLFGRPEHYKLNLAMRPDAIHPIEAGYDAFAPVLAGIVASRLHELGR